ncbi:MAG: hypothetical protein ACRDQU_12435 [Pseudonocardiaceae bacterium]
MSTASGRGWTLLPDVDIKPVDDLMLGPGGLLNVVPSWKLTELPLATLQVWCVKRGVYQFPTEELIEWLSTRIAGRNAIEICAGNGVLGRTLGIPTTDSHMQTKPEIADYYRAMRQCPITPPPDVQRFDANQAVNHYQPDVVIGAWVTQLWRPGDKEGSVQGVDELAIVKAAEYIHVGNDGTHGRKRVMRKQHERLRFDDWLISRGQDQSLNRIDVWRRGSK